MPSQKLGVRTPWKTFQLHNLFSPISHYSPLTHCAPARFPLFPKQAKPLPAPKPLLLQGLLPHTLVLRSSHVWFLLLSSTATSSESPSWTTVCKVAPYHSLFPIALPYFLYSIYLHVKLFMSDPKAHAFPTTSAVPNVSEIIPHSGS